MLGLSSRIRRQSDDSLAPISAFESETQAVIGAAAPYSERAIVHVVGVLFVVIILLMCVMKVDRVVAASGLIMPTGGSIYIQPLDRAMVRKINVRPGDVVKKDQVLAVMDPTFAAADALSLQRKQASDAALVARLEAEQAGVPYRPTGNDPDQALQLATWREAMAEKNQALANYDAQIRGLQTTAAQAHDDALKFKQEVDANSNIVARWKELESKGYGAPMQAMAAKTALLEADRQFSDANSQVAKGADDMAAIRAQRAAYLGNWYNQLGTALTAARNDLNTSTQDLVKASRTKDLTTIRSPVDAVVLKIADASVGTVVSPESGSATALFTLTPVGGASEAEIDVAAKDQGFIRPGDSVRLKLDAYRFIQHGTALGVVESISPGSFTTNQNGQAVPPYFKVRVKVTQARLRNVPADFRLLPGMTVTGDIVVGRRTIMAYIVEGALRTGREAMREP